MASPALRCSSLPPAALASGYASCLRLHCGLCIQVAGESSRLHLASALAALLRTSGASSCLHLAWPRSLLCSGRPARPRAHHPAPPCLCRGLASPGSFAPSSSTVRLRALSHRGVGILHASSRHIHLRFASPRLARFRYLA
ncbi:hypothetical protein ZWY2020_032573 [Hordeum vulgare]|nr:hypothetical protein ZWY2020_032573 [Hordeum vulgare]